MKPDVEAALQRAIQVRRQVLQGLTYADRIRLLETLLYDFFVQERATLLKWAALTGQSAQVDTGYIAQHVASIVLGEPGQGFKGKGLDLADGSEVKSAAILSGVDRPRWNHDMGTVASDNDRRSRGLQPKWQTYLEAPRIFYLLFDRVVDPALQGELVLRIRAWLIDAKQDKNWRDLITRFVASRAGNKYNLQLHPPVGYDDSIVVNSLGNLDFEQVKVLEVQMSGLRPNQSFTIRWVLKPRESLAPITGRCIALPWRRGERPSRLTDAADVQPDIVAIQQLVPHTDLKDLAEATAAEISMLPEVPSDDLQE